MPIASRSGLWVPPRGLPSRQRKNKMLATHAADGRPYEICPMCSARASLRENRPDGDTWWKCEACGYRDSDRLGPLN